MIKVKNYQGPVFRGSNHSSRSHKSKQISDSSQTGKRSKIYKPAFQQNESRIERHRDVLEQGNISQASQARQRHSGMFEQSFHKRPYYQSLSSQTLPHTSKTASVTHDETKSPSIQQTETCHLNPNKDKDWGIDHEKVSSDIENKQMKIPFLKHHQARKIEELDVYTDTTDDTLIGGSIPFNPNKVDRQDVMLDASHDIVTEEGFQLERTQRETYQVPFKHKKDGQMNESFVLSTEENSYLKGERSQTLTHNNPPEAKPNLNRRSSHSYHDEQSLEYRQLAQRLQKHKESYILFE